MPTNTLEVEELVKPVSEDRDYAFDFSRAPELKAGTGITLSSAIASSPLPSTGSLTVGSLTVLAAAFDDVPAGKGFTARISGGADDQTYRFAVTATLSNGRKLVLPCKLAVAADSE